MSYDRQITDHMIGKINEHLVGAKIVGAAHSRDGESFGFTVRQQNGVSFIVWVDRDEEGNGPGWLDIKEA